MNTLAEWKQKQIIGGHCDYLVSYSVDGVNKALFSATLKEAKKDVEKMIKKNRYLRPKIYKAKCGGRDNPTHFCVVDMVENRIYGQGETLNDAQALLNNFPFSRLYTLYI